MDKTYLSVLLLTLSPLLLMLVHILLSRFLNILKLNVSLQLSLILTELAFNIPVLLILFMINKNLSSLVYGFIVYNCLGYSYFHFFNMSETARRIKILVEIYKKGFINLKALESKYKSSFIINIRLKRLIELKQIVAKNSKYYLSGKILLFFANLMYLGRKILSLD